jgi:hypothetical protein
VCKTFPSCGTLHGGKSRGISSSYLALKNWLLVMLFLGAVLAGAVYLVKGGIAPGEPHWRLRGGTGGVRQILEALGQ